MQNASKAAIKRGQELAKFLDETPCFFTIGHMCRYLELRNVRRYRLIVSLKTLEVFFCLPAAKSAVVEDISSRQPWNSTWYTNPLPWWRWGRSVKILG